MFEILISAKQSSPSAYFTALVTMVAGKCWNWLNNQHKAPPVWEGLYVVMSPD